VPQDNAVETGVVEGVQILGVRHRSEVVALLEQPEQFTPVLPPAPVRGIAAESVLHFCDVRGQTTAKRAGRGRDAQPANDRPAGLRQDHMLAKRLVGILPPSAFEEARESIKMHSVAGALPQGGGLLSERPFGAPHHTVSDAGLIGGGTGVGRPGEVSPASQGVRFLDKFPEFPRNVLELLRQPLEHDPVVSRAFHAGGGHESLCVRASSRRIMRPELERHLN
jgi:magnesium chelatase family protein